MRHASNYRGHGPNSFFDETYNVERSDLPPAEKEKQIWIYRRRFEIMAAGKRVSNDEAKEQAEREWETRAGAAKA